MTEPGARSAQVMRSQFIEIDTLRKLPHYDPHNLLRDAGSADRTGLVHTAEEPPGPDIRCDHPLVDGALYPCRDRNGSYVTALAKQVDNHPAVLSLLNIFDG